MPDLQRVSNPARAAVAGFLVIAMFQVGLALGAPWGRASWGGAHEGTLPTNLRVASAVAIAVWLGAASLILARAGAFRPQPSRPIRWGTWALAALLGAGAVMNSASPSPWERFGWAPFTIALAILTGIVAMGDSRGSR